MKLERILIVDLETTGLDPKVDRVLEVAGILLDVELGVPIASASCLAKWHANPAEGVNDISQRLLGRLHVEWDAAHAFAPLAGLAEHAQAFAAHSAAFDRSFSPTLLAGRLPWICTQFGVDWPRGKWGASLVNTALAHGVSVHASHRALDDCLLLARIMTRARELAQRGGGLELIFRRALDRGVGVPRRCEHAGDAGQCRSWARTYSKSVVAPKCVDHGGSGQWVT